MKDCNQQNNAPDKARERAATTVVPNLDSRMLQDDIQPNTTTGRKEQVQQSKVLLLDEDSGAAPIAAMPRRRHVPPLMSREEMDRRLKEEEKHRAPRIAVVPNLAHLLQDNDNPSSSSPHFSPIGQSKEQSAIKNLRLAAATIPPPLVTARSAPAAPATLSQQERDAIMKQRDRNARAATVVPNLAHRLASIATPQHVEFPESPALQGAVSMPLTTTTTSTSPRFSALSTENRNNPIKHSEKKHRTSSRWMMMKSAKRSSQQEHPAVQQERDPQSASERLAARGNGNVDGLGMIAQANSQSSSSTSDDLLRARYAAATLAMTGNLTQAEKDEWLKDQQHREATYQTYTSSQEHEMERSSTLEQGSSEMGRRERSSTNAANGNVPANPVRTSRRGATPGAMAISEGMAQVLRKAVLPRVAPTTPPEYVAPVGRVSDTTDPDSSYDDLEGQGILEFDGTVQVMDQQIPIESENVIQGQSIVKKNEMEYKTLSRRKWYMVGAAVLIILIVIAVSVAVAVGGKPNETPGATDGIIESERRIALRKALVTEGVSSMEQLTDANKAQYDALTWLSDVDTETVIEDTLTMTQRYVLAVFYYSMNGPAWTDTSVWLNPSKHVCDWTRITCQAGDVAAIVEQNRINMEGVLPTELNALPLLTKLVIEKNAVHGFAGPIHALTELTLNEASLGERFKDIPTPILEMTNLQTLYLYNNGLIGTIPTEIEKLSSLAIVDLSSNNLSGTLPTQLMALTNLMDIVVAQNQFGGDIFKTLGGISNLRAFLGSYNSFTGTIGTEIATLSNLESLELSQNKLVGPFPNFIFNISSLVILDVSFNQLTGTLSSAIGELEKLEILHLTNTRVSGSIPSEIGRVSRLQSLQAIDCAMVGVIPTEIGLLTNMIHLQLSNNEFEGTIPTELGNLGNLQTLHLNDNSLTGPIPSQLGQLTALSDLGLANNDLSGNLPSEICAIPSLASVDLVGAFPRDGLSCGDCAKCV